MAVSWCRAPEVQLSCLISRGSLMSLTKWVWPIERLLGTRPALVTARPSLVVVVSGCDSGLGFQLARAARARGLTVVAGLLQGPQGAGGRRLSVAKDPHLHLVQLDVTSEESVDSVKDYVEKLLKDNPEYGLHAVVNNAGVMVMGEFEWQPSALWQLQLAVNVGGALRLSRALLPSLRASGRGGAAPRLITVGSHCAAQPLRGLAPYSASKAALAAWVEALRPELMQYGVHVVDFIPGRMVASTNLVAQQRVYTEKMRASLTPEQRSFYGEYFERFTRYVDLVGGEHRDPDALEDPALEGMFAAALLEETPALQYKHQPWRYTLYYNLMRMAPLASLRYWLMEKLICMPRYRAPEERKSE